MNNMQIIFYFFYTSYGEPHFGGEGKKAPPTLLKQTIDREKAMQYICFPSYVRANPICELCHLSDSHYLLYLFWKIFA